MFKKIWKFLFGPTIYKLTVWTTTVDGVTVERSYDMRSFKKKTPNHIIGKDANGCFFELKTKEELDYRITEIK
jgi:hypothetical protein